MIFNKKLENGTACDYRGETELPPQVVLRLGKRALRHCGNEQERLRVQSSTPG